MNNRRPIPPFHALLLPLLLVGFVPPPRRGPVLMVGPPVPPPPPEPPPPEFVTWEPSGHPLQHHRLALVDGVQGLPLVRVWQAPLLPYRPLLEPPPRPSVASQHAPKTPEGERNRTRAERRKARKQKQKQKRGHR